MKKYKLFIRVLCVILAISLFSGCAGGFGQPNIQLTEEQEANIQMFVQHRDELTLRLSWTITKPANRVHVAEFITDEGELYTWFTIAYVEKTSSWTELFFAESYFASNGTLKNSTGYAHSDWQIDAVAVDLENMSDEELTEILREAYIAYLKKESKK